MTTFQAGALYRPPPRVDLLDESAWEWSDLDRAADALSSARELCPPPLAEESRWSERLRAGLQGVVSDEMRCALEELIAVVENVDDAVHTALCHLWRARASVVDAWAARLYAPPASAWPGAPAQTYEIETMRAELRAVTAALQHDRSVEASFASKMERWVWLGLYFATHDDVTQVQAAINGAHEAAKRAFAELYE